MPRIAQPVNHRVISQTVVVLIGVALLSRRATQRVGGLHSPLPLGGIFAATGGPERDPHRRLRRRIDGVIPVPELTVANQKG